MAERPTRVRWLIVAAIFVVYVPMFIDRVNISVATKYIMAEYGLTSVQMGATFSMFVLGYALFQILTPLLAREFGWAGALYAAAGIAALGSLFWIGMASAAREEHGARA